MAADRATRRLRSCGLFAALLLAACSGDAAPSSTLPGDAPSRVAESALDGSSPTHVVPADAPVVAFLGDSIAAGLHLAADEAFPAVLEAELASEGVPFRHLNAGVSGDTSAGGLRRLDWLLASGPDVVVVELGGNDGLRGQPVAAIETNLRAIVRRIRESGARVLLLGMRLPTSYGAEYAGAFAEIYERIAREEKVALVPFFMEGVGGVARMNLEDGLHPTAEGHRRLATNVLPELRRLLSE